MSSSDRPAPRTEPASARLAALLGLPAPQPLNPDQEAAYQRWMDDGDDAVVAANARHAHRAA